MKQIFFAILITISNILYSQNNFGNIFKYDTSFFSNNKIDCIRNDNVISLHNDTIFSIDNSQKTNDYINILGFSINNNSFFELKAYFYNDDYLKDLKFTPIVDFWFKNDTLYLLLFKSIYKFGRNNDSYNLISKIELDFSPNRAMLLSNGNVLLYKSNFKSDNNMYMFDCENNKVLYNKELQSPIPILSIFQPRDILCTDNYHIYYSPANEYIINIYDYNFNLVDSIVYSKKKWQSFPINRVKNVLEKTKMQVDIIEALSDDVRDKYSSIMRLFILDDKLIVMYFMKEDGKNLYLYDVWKNIKGNWKLILEGINDYDKQNLKTKDRFIPFSKFVFYKGCIYRFSSLTPIFRDNFKSEKEYIKAYENYQIENDCLLGIEKLWIK